MEQLSQAEREELVGRLNQRVAESVLTGTEKESLLLQGVQSRLYTLERHGLNYAKLYQDFEGGYDLEQLKRVLQRVRQDKEDGVHPFVDPAQARELDRHLKKVLKKHKAKKAAAQEGGEEGTDEAEAKEDASPESA